LGLNLTAANIVVVFDPNWNVTWDLQAQDRAHRIGQTRYTKVFRLVSAGTIEEMQYNRQVYKQQLANIGLKGQTERRYFKGVAGVKGQEGEIFGLANLFRLSTDSVFTNDIIERTTKREENYKIIKSQLSTSDSSVHNQQHDTTEKDQLDELLRQSGVVYSHLNTDVVGESEMEKELSEMFVEMEKDKRYSGDDDLLFSSPLISRGIAHVVEELRGNKTNKSKKSKKNDRVKFLSLDVSPTKTLQPKHDPNE